MSEIDRHRKGLRWTMGAPQHELLLALLAQLDRAIDGPTDDPIVERLFPRAVEGDTDADTELRMLLAGDLLLRRHEAITRCIGVLARAKAIRHERMQLDLVEDEPDLLLAVLNDVRLALGARVGTTAVELRQLIDEHDEERHQALATMDLLAWFQMQLLEQIDPASARFDGPDGPDAVG